uniref:NADH dehydrogenase-like complex O n=1 Tax=Pelargonium hortorum TaxID=4031 RepID=A0A0F7GZE8_PELHO
MAFSAIFTQKSLTCFSSFPQTLRRTNPLLPPSVRVVRAAAEPEAAAEKAEAADSPAAAAKPKKPVYSMKKGQIVRVDKEKYLNSVNYLSVGHPPYYKGLDYIYEDRGEILDLRIFDTGEYALVAWVGIPTAPAWLPTDMLIESESLKYERM